MVFTVEDFDNLKKKTNLNDPHQKMIANVLSATGLIVQVDYLGSWFVKMGKNRINKEIKIHTAIMQDHQ